jgi:hypothetical protein
MDKCIPSAFLFNRKTAKWTQVADMKVEKGHLACGMVSSTNGERVLINTLYSIVQGCPDELIHFAHVLHNCMAISIYFVKGFQ